MTCDGQHGHSAAGVRTADLDYHLPTELIAQEPSAPRDAARLLVVGDPPLHRQVRDLDALLAPGDLLVVNRTRVIPARLAARTATGGTREVLLIHGEEGDPDAWRCLVRGTVRTGTALDLHGVLVTVAALHDDGARTLRFPPGTDVLALADKHGQVPLPPYIRREVRPADRDRYQTVFAQTPGSVAAPTAGLHFTPALLARLDARGVRRAAVELAIGPGTFKPIDTETVEDFRIHAEHCTVPPETIAAVAATRAAGGRVVAVGTTAVRALETAWRQPSGPAPWRGWTRLYLHPPQRLVAVDGLMTNFHLPRSSLLCLVACCTGLERLLALYRLAIAERYRFFSYGDAMLVLPGRSSGNGVGS